MNCAGQFDFDLWRFLQFGFNFSVSLCASSTEYMFFLMKQQMKWANEFTYIVHVSIFVLCMWRDKCLMLLLLESRNIWWYCHCIYHSVIWWW